MEAPDVAKQFVDLVLKYNWRAVLKLTEEEEKIFLALLALAGFGEVKLIHGNLFFPNVHLKDDRFLVNRGCPFKVHTLADEPYQFATGWLDCAFRRVVMGKSVDGETNEQIIEALQKEVERSRPLQPISLTLFGDVLAEALPESVARSLFAYFIDHARDNKPMPLFGHDFPVGVHDHCLGSIYRVHATLHFDALLCKKCYLRVLFPKEVETYGELRKALREWISVEHKRNHHGTKVFGG